MPEIVGAIVGAVAVIGIPVVAWLSRRVTQEGRRTMRVERLGALYALMPESPEKETFKVHVTTAVASLNSWLDPDNARRRKIVRSVSTVTYVVGVLTVLITVPLVNTLTNPWLTSVLGIIIGLAIALVTFAASYLTERSSQVRKSEKAATAERAAAETRMKALISGESQ